VNLVGEHYHNAFLDLDLGYFPANDLPNFTNFLKQVMEIYNKALTQVVDAEHSCGKYLERVSSQCIKLKLDETGSPVDGWLKVGQHINLINLLVTDLMEKAIRTRVLQLLRQYIQPGTTKFGRLFEIELQQPLESIYDENVYNNNGLRFITTRKAKRINNIEGELDHYIFEPGYIRLEHTLSNPADIESFHTSCRLFSIIPTPDPEGRYDCATSTHPKNVCEHVEGGGGVTST
jgi:hypothetical protein